MAVVDVEVAVSMSCYSTVAAGTSIGTDGLGTCVGIVIVGRNGTFCGHMACLIAVPGGPGTPAFERVKNSARVKLQDIDLGGVGKIEVVGICSSGADHSTEAIKAGFLEVFDAAERFDGTCIYYRDRGLSGNDNTLRGARTVHEPGDWDAG